MAERAKRHKGKNATARGSSSQEQLVDDFFTSEEQRQNYLTKFANRKVASSKYVDVPFFEKELKTNREQFSIFPCIKRDGLYKLLKNKKKWSPKNVRIFYANMKWNDVANYIVSEIRGQEVKIEQHELAKLLGTEASRYMFGDHQSTLSKINGYDAQIVLKSLLAQPSEYLMDTTNFAASKFKFKNRLLHHIIQDCVTNKQENHAYASAAEQFIMYCISSDKKFNLQYFIIEKMTRCSKTTGLSLSYASLVSWILEKNGINPLTDEIESPSAIDVNSLGEREATHAPNGSSSQPPVHGPGNSEVLSAIQHLQHSVDEGFVQVNTRLNEFCTRIQALEVATVDNSQMIKDVERRFENQD
ncbi:hypothetical protein G2W53_033849 [Senna tora]|uniref:Putative plant transposon protein domain-containing protein n=1 Tax=Senna tora TaxID=362788 RepID=A0A834SYA8_9FABA|nr:hypothetical protein G2W53_033849 [Senna tora]